MRTRQMRSLLALGTLLWTVALASADEPGMSESASKSSNWSQDQSSVPGVRQVAYLSEIEVNNEQLPRMMELMPGHVYEPAVDCGSGCYCASDYHAGGCPQCACGCPECTGGCPPCTGYGAPNACGGQPRAGMCYAETQIMFLRAHVLEESLGKLSEKYEFTPRFIAGYEAASGLGARGRYWTYGRTTPNLTDADNAFRLEFEVIDVEGTSRLRTERADLLLAGGFRWVNADIGVGDDWVSSDMPGLTVAADVRTWLCKSSGSQWSGVAGARWSILGADWEGDDDGFIEPTRDDNLVATELYGGFEYLCRCRSWDFYARLVFETQNWRSDALGESADTDSLGFVGPGIHVGATF